MMFTTGCGGSQTAEQVKQDANAAVEEVKQGAEAAVDDAKQAADAAVADVAKLADDAKKAMDDLKAGNVDKGAFALGGVVPGVKVEEVKEFLGEPVDTDGTNLAYSNGLDIKVADGVVQEVSTKYDGLATPAAVAVGTPEAEVKSAYGDAVSVTQGDNGTSTYKYVSSDKLRTLEISTQGGNVSEIKCLLNK